MEKKYILTDKTKTIQDIRDGNVSSITLHRIKALKNFGLAQVGDLGDWIESEDNLSQKRDLLGA